MTTDLRLVLQGRTKNHLDSLTAKIDQPIGSAQIPQNHVIITVVVIELTKGFQLLVEHVTCDDLHAVQQRFPTCVEPVKFILDHFLKS